MTPRVAVIAWVAAALASGGSAAVVGCSSPAALLGQGGQCLQTTDCQQGLVCVTQKNGAKACSTDLTSTVSTEEAGAKPVRDAAAGDARSADGATAVPGDGGGAGTTDASGSAEAQAQAGDSGAGG